jgi:hypothetical protein
MNKNLFLCSLHAILFVIAAKPAVVQEPIGMAWYYQMPYPHRGENLKWGYINSNGIQVVWLAPLREDWQVSRRVTNGVTLMRKVSK